MMARMMKMIPSNMFQLLLSKASSLIGWTNRTIPAAKMVREQSINTYFFAFFGSITKIIRYNRPVQTAMASDTSVILND